ncbi:MAG: hypothetical protein JW849_07690 [Phycisphaerae bacterium]|nr:hypothetical protein [Phycisphaerae bacterium]
MNVNEQQYERIARYLDGEDVSLNTDERAVVEDIRRSEAMLRDRLDVTPPDHVLQRALRRRQTKILLRSRWKLRFTLAGATVAAAAAVVLLAVSLLLRPTAPQLPDNLAEPIAAPRPGVDVPFSDVMASMEADGDFDQDIDQLMEEFERDAFGIAVTPEMFGNDDPDHRPGVRENRIQPVPKEDVRNVPHESESVDPIEAY